jgi:N-acetylmuramoyl-L-alanine amidase
MKHYSFYLLWFVLSSLGNPVFAQQEHTKQLILIDPGHGGMDSGAIGSNGINEKDIVLKVAKEVVRLNKELYRDTFEIYLSRYTDTFISLGNRTKLAKILNVDVFVSIHCNQAPNNSAQGIEIFVQLAPEEPHGKVSRRAERLAKAMALGLNTNLGFKSRGMKQANFQVLRDTQELCPAVLLELGFLSNEVEAKHNTKQTSLTAYALVILETLIKHINYD